MFLATNGGHEHHDKVSIVQTNACDGISPANFDNVSHFQFWERWAFIFCSTAPAQPIATDSGRFLVADTRLYTLLCRFTGPSIGRSVRSSIGKFFRTNAFLLLYYPCPPVRDWGSDLVWNKRDSPALTFWLCVSLYGGWKLGCFISHWKLTFITPCVILSV